MKLFLYSRSLIVSLLGLVALLGYTSCREDEAMTLRASVSELTVQMGQTPARIIVQYGDIPVAPVWSVEPAEVARVTSGLVTPLKVGRATLTATYQGQSVQVALTVQEAPQKPLLITPTALTLEVGQTANVSATYEGKSVTPSWTSSDAGVATVTEAGLVTALSAGTATITASYNGQSATATLTVTKRAVTFLLPSFEIFNELSELQTYEQGRGHATSVDANNSRLTVTTGNADFPKIIYEPFQRIYMETTSEILRSAEFIAFMKENGFDTTGQQEANLPIVRYTTSKSTIVGVYAILEPLKIEGTTTTLPVGLYAAAVNPRPESFMAPIIDWTKTEAQISAELVGKGFQDLGSQASGGYTEHSFFARLSNEYPGYVMQAYKFDASGKLVQSELIFFPYVFILKNLSRPLTPTDHFVSLTTAAGFTEVAIANDAMRTKGYVHSTHDVKFTFSLYQVTINQVDRYGAALTFTPKTASAYIY